jgi:L-ascorbate metabolism protein UlaG (beta-lactamase superfamily)
MKIHFIGHSCFLIESQGGRRLLTDPFDESVGYPLPEGEVDVVTVSHDHFDHNATERVAGSPQVIQSAGQHEAGGFAIRGVQAPHDGAQGMDRGLSLCFTITADGASICHLGDLGVVPDDALAGSLGRPDVLLVPVGGRYTIDRHQALETIRKLRPRAAVPMHFRSRHCTFPIEPLDAFLQAAKGHQRREVLDTADLPEPGACQVIVLPFAGT